MGEREQHEAGLSTAEVEELTRRGEVNHAPDDGMRSTWQIVRANLFTRINAIFAILVALVVATGSLRNALFGLAIVINSIVGIAQELRARHTLKQLSIVNTAEVTVRRDGEAKKIPTTDIVTGDIVELSSGSQIAVDGVVVRADHLDVDESLLTGESDPIDKRSDDDLRSGSFVVAGSGLMRATAVGGDSYAAKLTADAGEFTLVRSELRSGIDSILKVITYLLIPAGLITIVNQLLLARDDWKQAVLGMVAALTPMVPEGLVLLTSVAFAVGVIRLGRRQCLVNELPAIEGLARVDVVCADKTGTLTEPGMTLERVEALGDTDEGSAKEALAALAHADEHPNATMLAVKDAFGDAPGWGVEARAPFSSATKWSGVSFAGHGNWVMGAADILLDPDSADGERATEVGASGARVLLLAEAETRVDADGAPGELTPRALVVLAQKVRPDAAKTLEYFHDQGVEVKVISGDNARSVGAVAESLGLGEADQALDARKLPTDTAELADALDKGVVFGRVKPDGKRAMVRALHSRDHIVAMTGDGVNDVLALKDADVGVAMGSGSDATRAVAQIVLLDNKFATLPHVVAEGRRVIGNIERVAHLFLTKTIYAVTLALVIGLLGLGAHLFHTPSLAYPFEPIHLTIAAWFTIGVPSFVLSLLPNSERARSGFVPRVMRFAIPSGLVIAAVTLACYLLVRHGQGGGADAVTDGGFGAGHTQIATATLTTLIACSWWVLVIVARPLDRLRLALVTACFLAYIPMFLLPFTRRWFSLDPTNLSRMAIAAACALAGVAALESVHRVVARRQGQAPAVHG
ncbi:HAD-IC family P-type ATPase [Dermacoccus nishinomiyaensis]|uniref:HAD-IC family P-type ATPase n=1 Tax=Dermacoccus nishinomiyaensis TaxID=1274 RepID=UPI0011A6628F|nr:HAD-IC family P-type ATPase [Dermacoccus nishinomiyaensis]